jgi:hypothetical protein
MKSSGAYKVALARVKSHPKVTAALGTPVKEGWFLTGTVNVNGSGENADVSIPLSGPKGEGTLFAGASKSAGQWSFSKLIFQDSAGQRTDLLTGRRPRRKE